MKNVCLVKVKRMNQIMALFKRQIEFLDTFEQKMFDHLKKVISDNSFVLKSFITNKQLYDKGIDGKEKRLKGYTRTTIRIKLSKGQVVDRTTLKDKGDFYASIIIDAYQDRIEISSNVTHAKYLIKRYGQDIMKPTAGNMSDFLRNYFIPSLKQKYGKTTR